MCICGVCGGVGEGDLERKGVPTSDILPASPREQLMAPGQGTVVVFSSPKITSQGKEGESNYCAF